MKSDANIIYILLEKIIGNFNKSYIERIYYLITLESLVILPSFRCKVK